MSIFVFFITGLFSWFGAKTVGNSEDNIRLAATNTEVVHAIDRLNTTLTKMTNRIMLIEHNEHKLDNRLIRLEEHIGRWILKKH